MLACIPSATILGARGIAVHVEAHVTKGLPGFTLVGGPDTACREAIHRTRVAFLSAQLPWPATTRRVTVNLAPPSVRKLGTALDLAIAVGVLVAAGEVAAADVAGMAFLGELGLDGSLRPVPGVVPMAGALGSRPETRGIVVPHASYHEACIAAPGLVRSVATLGELAAVLRGLVAWPEPPEAPRMPPEPPVPDLADVRGQATARQALEVAAAGGHHLLLVGPPGAGKTMLAHRLGGILPPLDHGAALEVTSIWSAAGLPLPPGGLVRRPPFRAPHHSASVASIVGGGTALVRPGEVSCAHRGTLFLDELGEFPPQALEALRTPIEQGVVRIARARQVVELPARFQLVAATNPCPCGDDGPGCRCTPSMRARYLRRLSGPLLDRFDLRVVVARPSASEVVGRGPAEASGAVAERVLAAREVARARGTPPNGELGASELDEVAVPGEDAAGLLQRAVATGRLSGRGVARVRAVARTLADLHGRPGPVLAAEHIALAMALRQPVFQPDDPALAGGLR